MEKLRADLKKQVEYMQARSINFDCSKVNLDKLCLDLNAFQSSFDIEDMGRVYISAINPTDAYSLMLMGKSYQKYEEYENGITCFVSSIRTSASLFVMTSSLRCLSEICMKLSQFVAALRLLNVAYKLCTMYELTITPSFVNDIYPKKRKKTKRKLKKMVCSYCGRKGKLQCCTGCMTAVYCSKLCQKRHWSLDHRKNCDNAVWSKYYRMMKAQLIFADLDSL